FFCCFKVSSVTFAAFSAASSMMCFSVHSMVCASPCTNENILINFLCHLSFSLFTIATCPLSHGYAPLSLDFSRSGKRPLGGRKLSPFLLLFMWFGLDNLHCHNHVVDPPVHAGERIVLGAVQLLRVQVKVKEPARRVDLHVAGILHKGLNF